MNQATSNKVYLIDSSIYVFRAWFTVSDAVTNAEGQPTNAVFGFADFLIQLLDQTKANLVACAFDESLSTSYRNQIYPAYKANRDPAPAELKQQFQWCRQLTRVLGIAEFGSQQYEADDIIASLACVARRANHPVVVVSGDKDLLQTLKPGDELWNFAKRQRLGVKQAEQEWGVPTHQVDQLQALMGDSVDNIPGVPGVGRKTAAALLRHFGDLPTLLASIDRVSEMKLRGAKRIQAALNEHRDTVLLAHRLTRLCDSIEVPQDLNTLRRRAVDTDAFKQLADQLNFSTLRRNRILKAATI